MINSYLTVHSGASDEIVIQKSRFIGFAFPSKTESEALAYIKDLKDQYHDATHHCYAYVIGENSGIMRYSDDGEPGGTAGLPIMNVLRSKGVVNCCIVVVRYFGGTKLGTGGLARAYTQGCQIALRAAGLVRMEKTLVQSCRIPYSYWDSVQRLLPRIPARVDSVSYGADIEFSLYTRIQDSSSVTESIQSVSNRSISILDTKEEFSEWAENEIQF